MLLKCMYQQGFLIWNVKIKNFWLITNNLDAYFFKNRLFAFLSQKLYLILAAKSSLRTVLL